MFNKSVRHRYNILIKCLLLSLLLILLTESTKKILNIDKLILDSLSDKLTQNQISNLYETQTNWKYLSYIFVPVILILKTTIISFILYIGIFFYSKKKISILQLWIIVINAEFIFLLMGIVKLIWFCFFQTNYTLEDFQNYYPLSAINLFNYKEMNTWFVYPLQTLNFFEFSYWLFLSYFIGIIASPFKNQDQNKYPIDIGLNIVATSYIPALILWVVVIMFFTLNYS